MRAILASRRARSNRFEEEGVKFASPNGSVLGDGSIFEPWELNYALTHLPASETLYLRGGTYEGVYIASAGGSDESERRTVRSFPGEWAVIDSGISSGQGGLNITGDYWTIRDLELTNSSLDSRVLEESIPYDSTLRGSGLRISGNACNQINLLIHDNGNGIAWSEQAIGGLSYGIIVWNNGWAGSSNMRGHGHGWYIQNNGDNGEVKRVENVVSTNSGGCTLRIGAQNGRVDNCEVVKSSFANSSAPAAMTHLFNDGYRSADIEHGSGEFSYENLTLDKVRIYELSNSYSGGIRNNYADNGPSTGLVITNCDLRPGAVDGILKSTHNTNVIISNNIAHGDGVGPSNEMLAFAQTTMPAGEWNNNSYYSMNGVYGFNFTGAGGAKTFPEWQTLTGYDLNSTYTPNTYPPDAIYVEPNLHEEGRSHITVFNSRALADAVPVDLSGTGLESGDNYYIFNAMNPFGPAIASGVYGGNPVDIPMEESVAGSPANPVADLPPGPSTFPHFGVFIVRKYPTMQRSA